MAFQHLVVLPREQSANTQNPGGYCGVVVKNCCNQKADAARIGFLITTV
jgi:hypothetical protein